jgi:putative hemolysin
MHLSDLPTVYDYTPDYASNLAGSTEMFWPGDQGRWQAANLAGFGIANPASANCAAKGGVEEAGFCTLQDGTRCESFALLRGDCPKKPILGWVLLGYGLGYITAKAVRGAESRPRMLERHTRRFYRR